MDDLGLPLFLETSKSTKCFFKFMTVKKCGGPVDPTLNGVRGSWNQDSGHLGHPNRKRSKLRASCHALREAPSLLAHLCRHSYRSKNNLTWNSWYIYKICMYVRTYTHVGRYVCMYAWVRFWGVPPNSFGRFVSSLATQTAATGISQLETRLSLSAYAHLVCWEAQIHGPLELCGSFEG